MPHDPARLRKVLESAAPANIDWRFRPMFGGIGVYANDKMCMSLSDVGLAVKLASGDQETLLEHKGAKRLQYEPSMPPSKSYIVVPDTMLSDRKELGHWLALSAGHVAAAPAAKPRRRSRKMCAV
ncbi:MAG TPA: TfoX/Sxy family protein [Rhizomicrobium sp.]|nr:TfoX/Sxy family protein [Rhizomicrobium sp.]